MNIEVRGIGFPNKGAELMLAALVEMLIQRYPKAKIVIEPNCPFHLRAKYGVYQLGVAKVKNINVMQVLNFVPARLRLRFGIIMPKEIDVIIDASGFAYGDQWGVQKAINRLAGNIRKFKEYGKNTTRKVIMLPQAFGPFTSTQFKAAMSEIIDFSDAIYARDKLSYQYLSELKQSEKVKSSPDFTNVFQCAYAGHFSQEQHKVCFIPNNKMLEMKNEQGSDSYIKFMGELVKEAAIKGFSPFLLIHEGRNDEILGDKIIAYAGVKIPVIRPATATDVKAIIGKTKLVVSSRFHGLVSALSQGIPVIATGWSHKYQMLLEDYQVSDYLFDEKKSVQPAVSAMCDLMSDESIHIAVVNKIKTHSTIEKNKTHQMWAEIFSILDSIYRD